MHSPRLITLALAAAAIVAAAPATASAAPPPIVGATVCGTLYHCADLNVRLDGDGNGRATIAEAGIDCALTFGVQSGRCSGTIRWPVSEERHAVQYTYAAGGDSVWPGSDVAGSTQTDRLVLFPGDSIHTRVEYDLRRRTLSVTRSGPGTGRVTSEDGAIACGPAAGCAARYRDGATVVLKATPDAGATFRQWTGACFGQGATCTLKLSEAVSTNAVFDLPDAAATPSAPAATTSPAPTPPATAAGPPLTAKQATHHRRARRHNRRARHHRRARQRRV